MKIHCHLRLEIIHSSLPFLSEFSARDALFGNVRLACVRCSILFVKKREGSASAVVRGHAYHVGGCQKIELTLVSDVLASGNGDPQTVKGLLPNLIARDTVLLIDVNDLS